MKKIAWPALAFAAVLAVGCSTTAEQGEGEFIEPGIDSGVVSLPDSGIDDTMGQPIEAPAMSEPAFDPACPPPCEFPRDAVNDPASLLAQKIIYFDFDQATIRSEFIDVLAAHGRYLATYGDVKIRLEGHADERGSREYNIALGERRAISVRRQLLLEGVSAEQLEIISYGEELPAELGHDEAAWAKNRRVEIVYQ